MSLYAILVTHDNAYDIAGFEDISLTSADAAIAAITFTREGETMYIVYGETDANGYDTPVFLSQAELDAKYTYNPELIKICITKLSRK